ncbi:MAG: DUF3795 domain-containing protein, partial [Bacteroidales bacterium]
MEPTEIKDKIAPCGLNCSKCFAFEQGEIKKNAQKLNSLLGNFDIYANRFATLLNEPVFDKFQDFKQVLNYFSEVKCKGCRNENCKLFQNCRVRECSRDKKIDFCYQCTEFPCNKTGFDEHLSNRSVL